MKMRLFRTLIVFATVLGFRADAVEKTNVAAAPETFESISNEHRKALSGFFTRMNKAKTQEERNKIGRDFPAPTRYVGRMMKVADRDPKSPDAIRALVWVVQTAYQDPAAAKAVTLLLRNHADSELIDARMAFMLEYSRAKDTPRLLDALIAKSPDRATRATAMMVKGKQLMRKDPKAGEALLEKVVSDFADAKVMDRSIARMAEGELFEVRNLGIGKIAPDIEGEDIDGVKFKLSDYRGKVVVIDFWGDW